MCPRPVLFAALLLGSLSVGTAQAGWNDFWHGVHVDFHRSNCWPEPFNHPDRLAVRAPFQVMINNGWRAQTTLGSHHFDRDSHELNHAGKLKLSYIVSRTPPQYRNVFVYQADDPRNTSARMQAVRAALDRMTYSEETPPVIATHIAPPSRAASYVDAIDRKAQSSIPPPVLPAMEGIDSGSN